MVGSKLKSLLSKAEGVFSNKFSVFIEKGLPSETLIAWHDWPTKRFGSIHDVVVIIAITCVRTLSLNLWKNCGHYAQFRHFLVQGMANEWPKRTNFIGTQVLWKLLYRDTRENISSKIIEGTKIGPILESILHTTRYNHLTLCQKWKIDVTNLLLDHVY